MPEEDFHLSDQTRFQAHWEASSGRRPCRSTATACRRAECASHVLDRLLNTSP
jgi:hypothetical protein